MKRAVLSSKSGEVEKVIERRREGQWEGRREEGGNDRRREAVKEGRVGGWRERRIKLGRKGQEWEEGSQKGGEKISTNGPGEKVGRSKGRAGGEVNVPSWALGSPMMPSGSSWLPHGHSKSLQGPKSPERSHKDAKIFRRPQEQ